MPDGSYSANTNTCDVGCRCSTQPAETAAFCWSTMIPVAPSAKSSTHASAVNVFDDHTIGRLDTTIPVPLNCSAKSTTSPVVPDDPSELPVDASVVVSDPVLELDVDVDDPDELGAPVLDASSLPVVDPVVST